MPVSPGAPGAGGRPAVVGRCCWLRVDAAVCARAPMRRQDVPSYVKASEPEAAGGDDGLAELEASMAV
eukprot:COSAG01_NODE_1021_length_12074_cov_7.519876_12_plen_68_part_00